MAKDHFAYVGAIRKCIDEIEHLKKDLWNIIMDSKVDMNNRIQATKELHSLSKTSVLLIKDLPFVTNLSKLYDGDILNSSYNNIIQSKNPYSNSNSHEVAPNRMQRTEFNRENLDNPFNYDIIKDDKKENELENNNTNPSPKYKQVDDEVIENMQSRLNYSDGAISPDNLKSIKRLKEIFDD